MEGDYESAANLAHSYRHDGIVDEKFEALDATLDVLTHRPDRALQKFLELLNKLISSRPFRNSEYIEIYCRFYIALIRGEESSQFLNLVRATPATNFIRRVLPLPRDAAEFAAISKDFLRSSRHASSGPAFGPRAGA